MSNGTYDIIIIGSGAGGGTLARRVISSWIIGLVITPFRCEFSWGKGPSEG
jgi:hypothetical protein